MVFCGLQLSTQSNGEVSIQPNKSRVERILNLPCPTSKEEVQSLLGLLGTLMLWFPNLSITTDPIRDLLRKNAYFLWTREDSACLSLIKEKLGNILVMSPFEPTRPSYIFTDASRSGIGFCLLQSVANSRFFIRCGSSNLTPSQKCYSTYDLELLRIVFALKALHSFFSSGLKFTILTDCAALNDIQ